MNNDEVARRTFDLANYKQPPGEGEEQLEFGFSLIQQLSIPRLANHVAYYP